MIELMKSSIKAKRKGPEPKLTPHVLSEINQGLPPKRFGRAQYLRAKAAELSVSVVAIYKANQRGGHANY